MRKEGLPPWRQTVTVPAGQQVKVAATFGAASNSSLRIIANETDVEVFVDGEPKGKAPVTMNAIKPGEHIVGGRKQRFKPVEQTVRVAAGENAIVSFRMEVAPPDRPRATLKVQSQVPNAEVFLDGSSLGRAPVDRNDLDPGKHYVVVHKDGFTDFKREIMLIENQTVTMVADLSASGGVRILSTPEGAEVQIDGELIGRTPVQRDTVTSGEHIIQFKMPGYFDHKETIKVEGGREKVFSVDLKALPSGPTPEQVAKRKMGMSSFGAKVNPVGGVTADFGAGYPYYLTVRLTVGAVAKPGIDVGVEFQTFFDIANLSMFGRMQLSRQGRSPSARAPTSAAAPASTAATPTSSICRRSARSRSAAWPPSTARCATRCGRTSSARAATQMTTASRKSRYCSTTPRFRGRCSTGPRAAASASAAAALLGLGVTAAIDRFLSFFFQLEFLPFPDRFSYEQRMAFAGKYNSALFADNDHFLYGMAGITLKF